MPLLFWLHVPLLAGVSAPRFARPTTPASSVRVLREVFPVSRRALLVRRRQCVKARRRFIRRLPSSGKLRENLRCVAVVNLTREARAGSPEWLNSRDETSFCVVRLSAPTAHWWSQWHSIVLRAHRWRWPKGAAERLDRVGPEEPACGIVATNDRKPAHYSTGCDRQLAAPWSGESTPDHDLILSGGWLLVQSN